MRESMRWVINAPSS